jgi:aspartyl-tRNA(Asn)/glutamyl-tRNA(Gln) amidotransferase subunit A
MGPLARSVRDAAAVMNAIAGYDERDDTSSRRPAPDFVPEMEPSIAGLRIGLPENFYFDRVEPEVATAVRGMAQRAEGLGACVIGVRMPDIAALNAVSRVILLAEASALMEPYWERRGDFGADVLALIDQGRLLPATDYVNAQRLRRVFQAEFRKLWERVDCLFTPATPTTAPRIGETTVEIDGRAEDVRLLSTRTVRGLNVVGVPALSVPCGLSSAGMPIGLQIVGKPFSEALILRVGQALAPEAPVPPAL